MGAPSLIQPAPLSTMLHKKRVGTCLSSYVMTAPLICNPPQEPGHGTTPQESQAKIGIGIIATNIFTIIAISDILLL